MWWRIPVGALINVITFGAVGTLGFIALRLSWPEYLAAEPMGPFTTSMMIARLSVAATASIAGAYIAGLTLRDSRLIPLIGGLVLLALFVPIHIQLWNNFPLWYHATFLTSLPLLALLGGSLAPRS